MDPVVFAVVVIVLVPLAIVWAMAKSASLRGPAPRAESRKPVQALVTEVIPDERPEEDDLEPPAYEVTSEPGEEPSPPPSPPAG